MVKGGDFVFIGEYHCTLDEKNRIIIPAKFRQSLGSEFVITKGLDNCLFVYSKEEWQEILNKYKNLPNTKDTRTFMRIFLSGAVICTIDKQGRTNITSLLMEYAHLKKECVVIGVNDHLEIWDSYDWQKFMEEANDISALADNLFAQ